MRILYITRKYPPVVGGMERMNYELVQALSRQADTHVLAWTHSQKLLPFFLLSSLVRAIGRALLIQTCPHVICLGDAVLSPLGVALRVITGCPVACVAHGLDVTFPHPIYRAAIPPALRRLSKILCVSRYTRDECIKRGIAENAITVIPNGIRPVEQKNMLIPSQARAMLRAYGLPLNNDGPILLTVGRLVKRKGVADFIEHALPEITRTIPELTYLVVGKGPMEPAIRETIANRALEKNVLLAGAIPDDLLAAAYRSADLFVMPNVPVPNNPEGFGIVALEASAYGLPVMASAIEGIRDAVQENKNGCLIPSGDYSGFADRIRSLLTDHVQRDTLSQSALAFAQAHSWDHIARQYIASFESLIHSNAG